MRYEQDFFSFCKFSYFEKATSVRAEIFRTLFVIISYLISRTFGFVDFMSEVLSYLSRLVMTQKSPSKILLQSIENNRTACQKTKNSALNTTQSIGINTNQLQFNRDIGTNTPNYAEQMAQALDDGHGTEEIVQMLMQSIILNKLGEK